MNHGTSRVRTRRNFLKSLAVVAGGVALAPVVRVLPSRAETPLARVAEQRLLMGTFVGITALGDSRGHAEETVGRAYAEIDRLVKIFSRFDSTSALSVLNAEGKLAGAPSELLDVVAQGQHFSRCSDRCFDMTVAPVVDLLERSKGKPDARDLRAALSLVDTQAVRQSGKGLAFSRPGMAVTLDGIAKGFIADRAADTLVAGGITHFLLDAGGDIRVQGFSDGQARPWRVAIEDPDKKGHYPAVLSLRSGAVATSGGYEVFFDSSRKSTHLVDPRNGNSPTYIKSVSVQAPTVMQADALATALSVMSPRQALALTASLPDHACLLVTSSGAQLPSRLWGIV